MNGDGRVEERGGHRTAAFPIAGVMAVTFVVRADLAVVQTSFPLAGHIRLHFSTTAIGVIAALAGFVAAAVARVIAARLSGRGMYTGALIGMVVVGASTALLGTRPDRVLFVTAILGTGAGMGLCFPCLATLAGRARSDSDSQSHIARYTAALSASLCAGPLLESLVLKMAHQSYATVFWVFSVFPVVGVAIFVAAIVSRCRDVRQSYRAATPATAEGTGSTSKRTGTAVERIFRFALLVLIVCEIPFGSVAYFGGVMAREEYRATSAEAALLFSVYFAVSFIARVVFITLPPVRNKARLARICCAVMTVGIAILAIFHGLDFMFVAMAVLGCGDGMTYTLALSLIAQYVPSDMLVRYNSRFTMVENAASAVVPLIAGALIGVAGFRWAFASMALALLAVGVLISLYRLDPALKPARAR